MAGGNQKLTVQIREMRESDLPAVLSIEAEAFTTPWSREQYESEFRNPKVSRLLVAEPVEKPGAIAGYACYMLIVDEAHITNLAVENSYRRRRVAEQLLHSLLAGAIAQGAERAMLEVRVSNEPAKKLYTKFGFAPVAIRKRYYPDNKEDALVMAAELNSIH